MSRRDLPLDFAMMSASNSPGVSSSVPMSRWKRVAGAGTKPEDIEVEPEGEASRSSTITSAPAALARNAATRPQAPAPMTTTSPRIDAVGFLA
jgi:hypothetical protein